MARYKVAITDILTSFTSVSRLQGHRRETRARKEFIKWVPAARNLLTSQRFCSIALSSASTIRSIRVWKADDVTTDSGSIDSPIGRTCEWTIVALSQSTRRFFIVRFNSTSPVWSSSPWTRVSVGTDRAPTRLVNDAETVPTSPRPSASHSTASRLQLRTQTRHGYDAR